MAEIQQQMETQFKHSSLGKESLLQQHQKSHRNVLVINNARARNGTANAYRNIVVNFAIIDNKTNPNYLQT